MNRFNLIVAEGHWDNYSNDTVKGLFDLLSDLFRSKSNGYKYVQFADPAGFDSCLKLIHDDKAHKYLYIGSHGDDTGIHGASNAKCLTFTSIKNRIGPYKGLFLGTCSFGKEETLIKFVRESNLTWCAGYKHDIDWLDSSGLDLAFWKIFQSYNTKGRKKSELNMIDETVRELQHKYSSLILELGFNVAIRYTDEDGIERVGTAY